MRSIPRVSRHFRLLLASVVLFMHACMALTWPQTVSAISAGSIISLTNSERAAAGLAPLNYNGALSSSAYAKAQDMLAKQYWAHTSPDGLTAWTFIGRAGYPYIAAGENLAKDYASDSAVVSAWMASPAHRANMLSGAYRDMGVAAVSGTLSGAPTTIVVAHFGATAAAPTPAPAPKPVATPQPKPVSRPSQPVVQAVAQAVEPVVTAAPPVIQVVEPPKPVKPAFGKQLWAMLGQLNDWKQSLAVTQTPA
jgi:hypothetical protein